MDLRSKLDMYKSQTAVKEKQLKMKGPDIHEVLNGINCTNDAGSFFMIEQRYPLSFFHGGYTFSHALKMDYSPLSKACKEVDQPVNIRDLVFLDTETTGLSGGTGTVAFLIGVGYFDNNTFILKQFFMRDYNEEPAMLNSLNSLLSQFKGLVTFNGKAFDWNLLSTRFTFNRLRPVMKNPIHVDLLYPSRMLWKLKLQSCRLSSLEENILRIFRVDDIPGAMIPGVYFKYLQDRNAADIKKVISHNETDIISMVSLMVKINTILMNPLVETEDWLELLGAGNIFEKCSDTDNAIQCYNHCSLTRNTSIKEIALKRLANLYRQSKDYPMAMEQLKNLLAGSNSPNIPVMIELAKYYEHRSKEIDKAAALVQSALDACLRMTLTRSLYYPDLRKRLERLKRKAIYQRIETAAAK